MSDFYVGQEVIEEKIFSREDVLDFAKITGDCNPLHLDEEYAKKSRFGRPIVHGILVTGCISKIIGTQLPGEGSIYMEQNIKFKKPIYINEKVFVKVRIIDRTGNLFTLETNVYNEKKNCVIEGQAKILYGESYKIESLK